MDADATPVFRKSSFSGEGDCLEWHHVPGGVLLRDSKHPEDPLLIASRMEWERFAVAAFMGRLLSFGLRFRRLGSETLVLDTRGGRLRLNASEWTAFRLAVACGEVGELHVR